MTDGCVNIQQQRIMTTISSKDIDWLETISSKFGVTEKVIRRWLKIHKLSGPGPGYWTQFRK